VFAMLCYSIAHGFKRIALFRGFTVVGFNAIWTFPLILYYGSQFKNKAEEFLLRKEDLPSYRGWQKYGRSRAFDMSITPLWVLNGVFHAALTVFTLCFVLGRKGEFISESCCFILTILINHRLIVETVYEKWNTWHSYQTASKKKLDIVKEKQDDIRKAEKDEKMREQKLKPLKEEEKRIGLNEATFKREQLIFSLKMLGIALGSVGAYLVFLFVTGSLGGFLSVFRAHTTVMIALVITGMTGDFLFTMLLGRINEDIRIQGSGEPQPGALKKINRLFAGSLYTLDSDHWKIMGFP